MICCMYRSRLKKCELIRLEWRSSNRFVVASVAGFTSSPSVALPTSAPVASALVCSLPCQKVEFFSDESMEMIP